MLSCNSIWLQVRLLNSNYSYQCLFCDGYERSHLPGGVLTFTSPMSAHMAQMMNLLKTPSSGPVTIFTDGLIPESSELINSLNGAKALGCQIKTGKILKLVAVKSPETGVTVVLEDGEEVKMGYLAHKPLTVLAGREMIESLGVEIEEHPALGDTVKVASFGGATNIRGVFSAGDAAVLAKSATSAMSSGKSTPEMVTR
jgi:hypothetical protein